MGSIYRHIAGDATGAVDYKLLSKRASIKVPNRTINLFLLSNTCSNSVDVDIYLKKELRVVTKRDVDDKPIENVDHSEIYYVLKGITIPSGTSYNVLEGLENFEYKSTFDVYIKVTGDETKTLDLILNYE
tara:strand:+ start:6527 stop:6916 length:390 start_codon:yes stop_codon:yes gene_type:complete